MLASGLDQKLPLARIVAARFFHVNMFAGGARHDGCGGVPVIGCGDGHDIHRRVGEHFAKIAEALRGGTLLLGGFLDAFGHRTFVHVADVGDFNVGQTSEAFNMRAAPAIGADDCGGDLVVRADSSGGH